MNFQILIFFIAILLFALFAFRQMSALISAPLVAIIVMLCAQLPVMDSLKNTFMPAAAGYVSNYFFVFFTGALFGAVYQFTGAAESIAHFISGLCRDKFVAPIIMIITGLLTLGGVSGFVVMFVIYPIALNLFKRSDISRRLIPGAISAGCWTWSMTAPGSPSIQNVIAMENLGTPSTAAPVASFIVSAAEFLLLFIWLEYRARRLKSKGYYFKDSRLTHQLTDDELNAEGRKYLPHWGIALIPIVVILVTFNFPIKKYALSVEAAVFLGVVLATLLMFKYVLGGISAWIAVFNKGAADSGVAILNTAIVVGFGGVVKTTQGFSDLIALLQHMNMPALVFVFITAALCAAACGSASGGEGMAFNALKDTYLGLGENLGYVHRIAALGAGAFATMPHQGAQITLLGICKMTHKEAYFDIAVTQIVIPVIAAVMFIILAAMGL